MTQHLRGTRRSIRQRRDVDLDRPRVLAYVHKYPPVHNAGAEWMLHGLLADSVRRGAEVRVVPVHGGDTTTLDGVEIIAPRSMRADSLFAWCDVAVTHLDVTRHAIAHARGAGRPLVHLIHNGRQVRYFRIRPTDGLLVANSEWIAATIPAGYRKTVVTPPVDLDRYGPAVGPHDRVVCMNLSPAKGGPMFWHLATRLPHRRFLGVLGAYGEQILPVGWESSHPNVEIIPNTAFVVDDVYRRARVVLMPSSYESWGRVAVEAAAGGVPVIYAPTPGLREALADAGVAVALDDPAAWEYAVDVICGNTEVWCSLAETGLERARALDPTAPGGSYDRWAAALRLALTG